MSGAYGLECMECGTLQAKQTENVDECADCGHAQFYVVFNADVPTRRC